MQWKMELITGSQTLAEAKNSKRHLSGRLILATTIRYTNDVTQLHNLKVH